MFLDRSVQWLENLTAIATMTRDAIRRNFTAMSPEVDTARTLELLDLRLFNNVKAASTTSRCVSDCSLLCRFT
jgi:hypothetical protein